MLVKVYVRPHNHSCSLAQRSCAPIGCSRLCVLGSVRYVLLAFGLEHSLPLARLGIPSAQCSEGLARSRTDRVRARTLVITLARVTMSLDRSLARSLSLVLSARLSALLVRTFTRFTSVPSFVYPCHRPPPCATLCVFRLAAISFTICFLVLHRRVSYGASPHYLWNFYFFRNPLLGSGGVRKDVAH